MSLPGVESARRRRVCHGRSLLGYVQPPPLHRRSYAHPLSSASVTPLRFLDCEILNERAIAARHRLEERLRHPALCTPHTSNGRQAFSLIQRPTEGQARAVDKRHSRNDMRGMNEEKFVSGLSKLGDQEDDCPVCLDSFLSGQTVVQLPCHHAFHSDCIIPWLRNHSHCPSCRANIS